MKPGARLGALGLLALMACLGGLPGRAGATPTSLAAKALPDLLAPDEGSLALFPASTVEFGACLLYDRRESARMGSLVYLEGYEPEWPGSEPAGPHFALALAGRGSLRGGYLLDGDTHTLLLAGTGGWGASLGWRIEAEGNDFESLERYETVVTSAHHGGEHRTREARLGIGWMKRSESGRGFEVAMAAGVVDGTSEWWNEDPLDSTDVDQRETWDLRGGIRLEAAARTTTAAPGLLLAARYRRDRRDARSPELPGWTDSFEEAALQSGWRVPRTAVDDVIVGFEVMRTRQEEHSPSLGYSSLPINRIVTTIWTGAAFVSMEERVNEALVLRGGVRAPITHEREEQRTDEVWLLGFEGVEGGVALTRGTKWEVLAPDIRVGGAWRWRSVEVEAWLVNDMRWEMPFMRWAARVSF